MASTTAIPERPTPERLLPSRPPRTATPTPRRWQRTRNEAAKAWASIARAADAVRDRNWSPTLTISGLGSIDIAAWETFGRGAAWLALGASLLIYDWQRDR